MGGFQVFSIAISKDGSELLAGNAPSGTIWDLATHTARKRLRWPRRMEPLVRPQRRRPRLAWEKKCPPLPRWLNPPQTRDVAFVSEHVVLVTGHRCTAIWNRATGAALRLPLVGLACAATSDGRWALVYSSGWKLRCLDPATGQTHAEVETRLNSRALAIAPDNRTCYTGNLDEITAWSLPDLQPLRTWRMNADLGARDIATRLLVSPEGRYLYVVGWDRAVRRVVLDA